MENYNSSEKRETYEISLAEIFKIFKRGLWKMLLAAFVLGLIAFTYFNYFVPKTYTARVKLYVETSAAAKENSYNALSDYNYATALVNTYVEMLSTNNFYSKLSENLDEKYTAKELSKIVQFKNESDDQQNQTEVFSSIVTANSPTEAKVIADSVADTAPGVIASLKNDDTELKIVDSATVPTEPSSPKVLRNTVLAAAAGFFLMLIYVFVRELIDNKIKYSAELTQINDIPILSAVPDFGSERFLLSNNTETDVTESGV
jgi:capsular polysaccharide biosynthesis protein